MFSGGSLLSLLLITVCCCLLGNTRHSLQLWPFYFVYVLNYPWEILWFCAKWVPGRPASRITSSLFCILKFTLSFLTHLCAFVSVKECTSSRQWIHISNITTFWRHLESLAVLCFSSWCLSVLSFFDSSQKSKSNRSLSSKVNQSRRAEWFCRKPNGYYSKIYIK